MQKNNRATDVVGAAYWLYDCGFNIISGGSLFSECRLKSTAHKQTDRQDSLFSQHIIMPLRNHPNTTPPYVTVKPLRFYDT